MHHVYMCDRSSGTNNLTDPKDKVIKTTGVYFGIVIEGLPYIVGLNVSQNQWQMVICRGGIITGELTWGEIPSRHFRGDKRGWRYNGGQYNGGSLYSNVVSTCICNKFHLQMVNLPVGTAAGSSEGGARGGGAG